MIGVCLVVRWRVRNQLESAFGCLFLLSHGVVLCSVCLVGLLGLECVVCFTITKVSFSFLFCGYPSLVVGFFDLVVDCKLNRLKHRMGGFSTWGGFH